MKMHNRRPKKQQKNSDTYRRRRLIHAARLSLQNEGTLGLAKKILNFSVRKTSEKKNQVKIKVKNLRSRIHTKLQVFESIQDKRGKRHIKATIERISESEDGLLSITGWAFREMACAGKNAPSGITISLPKQSLSTIEWKERNDVMAAFGSQHVPLLCGFTVVFEKPQNNEIVLHFTTAHDERLVIKRSLKSSSDGFSGPQLKLEKIDVYQNWLLINKPTRARCSSVAKLASLPLVKNTDLTSMHDAIHAAELVSFDVFDTILERRLPAPKDVFKIAEERLKHKLGNDSNFVNIRIKAESAARKKCRHEEITLAEIYEELATSCSIAPDILSLLREEEVKTELAFISPKMEGTLLYSFARSLNRKIAFVSDIYLDRETIEQALIKCGFPSWDILLVSSEKRLTKHTGKLFNLLLDHSGLPPEKILHIGDNHHSDIKMANHAGLQSARVKRTYELWEQRAPKAWWHDDNLNPAERIVIGALMHEFQNTYAHGFCQQNTSWLGNPRLLGFCLLGPVLLGFTLWLARQLKKNPDIEICAFLSRDGYYLNKAYDLLRQHQPELPEAKYIAASRRLCMSSDIRSWEDIKRVADVDHFPIKVRQLLTSRFGLDEISISEIPENIILKSGLRSIDDVVLRNSAEKYELLKLIQEVIIRSTKSSSSHYKNYLKKEEIDTRKCAVIDIGYSGTAQLAIANITNSKPVGFYLITNERAKKLEKSALAYDSWLAKGASDNHEFFQFVQLWELMLSATHGSASAMDQHGNWALDKNGIDSPEAGLALALIREGAMDFARKILNENICLMESNELTSKFCSAGIFDFFKSPAAEDIVLFSKLQFEDSFGGDNRPLLIRASAPNIALAKESIWPEGSRAISGAAARTAYDHLDLSTLKYLDSISIPAYEGILTTGRFDSLGWPHTDNNIAKIGFLLLIDDSTLTSAKDTIESIRQQLGSEVPTVAMWHGSETPNTGNLPSPMEKLIAYSKDGVRKTLETHKNIDHWWLIQGNVVLDSMAMIEAGATLAEHPASDVISFDHDAIRQNGQRHDSFFKPGYSLELLLSTPYLGASFVVSKSLISDFIESRMVSKLEHLSPTAFMWMLSLHAGMQQGNIKHIPKIIFSEISLAPDDSYFYKLATEMAILLQEAFSALGVNCEVALADWASEKMQLAFIPKFPDTGQSVAIIIPTKNNYKVVRTCIESLSKTTYENFKIYLVDNASDDPESIKYFKYLQTQRIEVRRIESPPEGFSYSFVNNRAVEQTDDEPLLLFLNNDTEVIEPRWLSQMVGWSTVPGVGSVGALLFYPHEEVQHAGITHKLLWGLLPAPTFKLVARGDNGYRDLLNLPRDSAAQTAACLLTPRDVFLKYGMFDDNDFKVAYNDCDFGFKLTQDGLRNVYCPDAILYHYEGLTRGSGRGNDKPSEEAAFVRKYSDWEDPFYNPNLTRNGTDFSIIPCAPVTTQNLTASVVAVTHNLKFEGAPLVLFELISHLGKSDGMSFRILSLEDGPLRKKYESIGCTVNIVDDPNSLFSSDTARWKPALNRVAAQLHGNDVLLSNTVLGWWAIEAAALIDMPSIWVIHESEPPFTHLREHNIDLVRAEAAMAYAYRVVFVSWATMEVYRNLENRNNFHVFHNGFDQQSYAERTRATNRVLSRKNLKITPEQITFLLPGTVCARKGQIDLIKAISLLDDALLDKVKFLIVGDVPSEYSHQLHDEIALLPVEKQRAISVLPHCSNIEDYFVAADVMIMSSRIEAFPKVIQEAMFFSLPIITTPVFGIVEQVQHGVSALFFNPDDHATLSAHIAALALDEKMRLKLGKNAKVSLDRLPSIEDMTREYRRIILEASLSCPVPVST